MVAVSAIREDDRDDLSAGKVFDELLEDLEADCILVPFGCLLGQDEADDTWADVHPCRVMRLGQR